MKKIKSIVTAFLIVAVFISSVITAQTIQAKSKTKVYEMYSCYVKTFKKSKGKIIIKTVKNTDHGDIGLEPISLKLKPAKNIKYTEYFVGENKPNRYLRFKDVKKVFKEDYTFYRENGIFDSPAGVRVFVKNKRIIEISLIYS